MHKMYKTNCTMPDSDAIPSVRNNAIKAPTLKINCRHPITRAPMCSSKTNRNFERHGSFDKNGIFADVTKFFQIFG